MNIFDFKCKYCGGELEAVEGMKRVGKCVYCGVKQTVPKLESEKRVMLFERANHLRRNNEFDKAEAIYEQLLNEDPTDPEAYWSLVLCRYGIEYVEDGRTMARIPTINRTQYVSILADEDYKAAIANATPEQKELYEEEATVINELQKEILEISRREEPFDIFICYKETDENGKRSRDSVLANELYHELTRDGYKVFFSHVTLQGKLGTAYEPYIFSALNSAKVMVVLGTQKEHFEAVWVRNEWSRFLGQIKNGEKKMLIPAYKDMDAYDLPVEFSHLQALDMARLGFMQDLTEGVKTILKAYKSEDPKPMAPERAEGNAPASPAPQPPQKKKKKSGIIPIICVLLALVAGVAVFLGRDGFKSELPEIKPSGNTPGVMETTRAETTAEETTPEETTPEETTPEETTPEETTPEETTPEETTPEETTPEETTSKETTSEETTVEIVDNTVYSITYIDAPTNSNPSTYTAQDTVFLVDAFWPGLSFSHWSDLSGNVVETIPRGTKGNITLKANWKYMENLVISNNASEPVLSLFNNELNAYQFVFDLGSINNVVLDELSAYKYNGATNYTWSISETVSFTESNAENIAKTISKSVTSGTSWSNAVESAKNSSHTTGGSISAGFSAGWGGTKASFEASMNVSSGSGSSTATTNTSGGSLGTTEGQSNTVSSTLTYVVDTSTQVTRSESLSPAMSPAGLYRCVQAGDIRVFAFVTYDVETQNYYIDILSYIVLTYETMLYTPVPEYNSKVSIVDSDPFTFDFDIDAIAEDVIANSYFVEFSANGGTGTMPRQMVLSNSSVALYKNQFTKAGNSFVGWRVVNGDESVVYLDGQNVKNLGSPKETVYLEAIWTSTEPVWVEADSGSFYFGDIPSTVDMNHDVFKNMKTEAYVEYETETTKRVVTIQWAGYVYWHWMYDTKAAGSSERAIYYKKGTGPDNGFGYKYFFAFTSTKGNYASDKYYCNSQYMTNYIVNDQKTSNKDCGGATRWFRFDYYICTYTDYVLSE